MDVIGQSVGECLRLCVTCDILEEHDAREFSAASFFEFFLDDRLPER